MNKIKIRCTWELKIDLEHEKQIELYIDFVPCDKIPENTKRFVCLLEPEGFLNLTERALDYQDCYDFIFTHNQNILDNCPKAILFPLWGDGTWLDNYVHNKKIFGVSTLVGFKRMLDGHELRHALWTNQHLIKIHRKFFLSQHNEGLTDFGNNPVMKEKKNKNELFDNQYHIVIENTKKENWFTEKLIDCLLSKTIPIYWGCSNIEKWFNTEGFHIVENLNDIINVCNSLTPEMYNKKLAIIEENYLKALEFSNTPERLKKTILSLI